MRAEQQGRDDVTPTVSIGIATLTPQAGLATRDLIKAADAALYRAKQTGRARCVTWPIVPETASAPGTFAFVEERAFAEERVLVEEKLAA